MKSTDGLWTFAKILFLRLRFILVFVLVGLIVGNWQLILNVTDKLTRPLLPYGTETGKKGELEWYCPMHPSVVREEPGNCPICGMPLSKRKHGEALEPPAGVLSRLQLSPFRIRQAGLATWEVRYQKLTREVRTVGFIDYDERRLAHVTSRIAGRIEKLSIDFTGKTVKEGDPLVWIYSPDLVTSEEEYLLALKALGDIGAREQHDESALSRAKSLVDSARQRLRLWGIAEEQIKALEETRRAETQTLIRSPMGGTVLSKNVLAGQYVSQGTELYLLGDLSFVWMEAKIFERDMGIIKEGQMVEVTCEAYPGQSFVGAVSFISPTVERDTRTMNVRMDVENPGGKLKPGMYVRAVLRVPLGKSGELFYGCCGNCPDVRSDAPGKCSRCAMELTLQGGVKHDGEKKAGEDGQGASPKEGAAEALAKERTIYVCEAHPEEVFDKPGQCFKGSCNGMELEERKIPPGAKLVYTCPNHPEVRADRPGICPVEKGGVKCGKELQFKVVSEASRLAESWTCPLHPKQAADGKSRCPDCGGEMKHMEYEEVLAVPTSAVIDSGLRKVVFLERGHGTFDAVEVELGPRAGEYYQVLKGLAVGDRVVTQGAFLLDAQARLNPAAGVTYFGASGQESQAAHGGHK